MKRQLISVCVSWSVLKYVWAYSQDKCTIRVPLLESIPIFVFSSGQIETLF
jgi:hypothetical protein